MPLFGIVYAKSFCPLKGIEAVISSVNRSHEKYSFHIHIDNGMVIRKRKEKSHFEENVGKGYV